MSTNQTNQTNETLPRPVAPRKKPGTWPADGIGLTTSPIIGARW